MISQPSRINITISFDLAQGSNFYRLSISMAMVLSLISAYFGWFEHAIHNFYIGADATECSRISVGDVLRSDACTKW